MGEIHLEPATNAKNNIPSLTDASRTVATSAKDWNSQR
jgi:hypothetical protein